MQRCEDLMDHARGQLAPWSAQWPEGQTVRGGVVLTLLASIVGGSHDGDSERHAGIRIDSKSTAFNRKGAAGIVYRDGALNVQLGAMDRVDRGGGKSEMVWEKGRSCLMAPKLFRAAGTGHRRSCPLPASARSPAAGTTGRSRAHRWLPISAFKPSERRCLALQPCSDHLSPRTSPRPQLDLSFDLTSASTHPPSPRPPSPPTRGP